MSWSEYLQMQQNASKSVQRPIASNSIQEPYFINYQKKTSVQAKISPYPTFLKQKPAAMPMAKPPFPKDLTIGI